MANVEVEQDKTKVNRKRKHIKADELLEMEKQMDLLKKQMLDIEQRNQDDSLNGESSEEDTLVEASENKENVHLPETSEESNETEIFMGTHPDDGKIGEPEFIKDVSDRLSVWLKDGIQKDERADILALVPRKTKECNMNAPLLNAEIQLNMKEEAIRRDKYFFNYQNMIGSSLSLTAMALSMILNDKNESIDRDLLLQYLSDSVKMQADTFHAWMLTRKIFITPGFDKNIKTALDKTSPTDFLFGDNVKDLISGVKTMEKVGKDLNTNKKVLTQKTSNSLNWKTSFGRGVNQMKRRNYFTSRTFNQRGGKRPYQQRQFAQTQPMQRKQ